VPLGQPASQPSDGFGPWHVGPEPSGTQAPPEPQSAVHCQYPVSRLQLQADDRHALGSQIMPFGQPSSHPRDGFGPWHSRSGRSDTHAPPEAQSSVQIQSPVVASQSHHDGRQALRSQVVPVGQPLPQPRAGFEPSQRFSGTHVFCAQSAVHVQPPVASSQAHWDEWHASGSQTMPLGHPFSQPRVEGLAPWQRDSPFSWPPPLTPRDSGSTLQAKRADNELQTSKACVSLRIEKPPDRSYGAFGRRIAPFPGQAKMIPAPIAESDFSSRDEARELADAFCMRRRRVSGQVTFRHGARLRCSSGASEGVEPHDERFR
jgi:hypothetical protein